jgi:hypothetical protein
MINKIKTIFLMMLCFGVFGGISNVFAQTGGNKVLVAAGGETLKQSDVDGLIGFYEWAFETQFTGEQREQYAQLKKAEFRRDPVNAKKGNNEVSGFLSQAASMSQSEQTRVRSSFVKSFVPQIRKSTDDAEAQFLVGVYDAAHGNGSGGETASNNADDATDSSAGGDISILIGKWVWSRTGSTTWTPGGSYVGGNGSRFTYSFSANGAVEYNGIMNVMAGSCSQQVFMSKKGRATLSGGTLTIRWSSGTSKRDFSCDTANNYTKNLPAETETLKVSFKSNSTGQKLFCTGEGQGQTCFSPTK